MCPCLSVYVCAFFSFFFFLLLFRFTTNSVFFLFSVFLFKKCSLRSFDNRNYVIAHLLVCISFTRTHSPHRYTECLSLPLVVSVQHTQLLLPVSGVCKYVCRLSFVVVVAVGRVNSPLYEYNKFVYFVEPLVKHDSMDVNSDR